MNRGLYVLKRLALGVPVIIFGLTMAFLILELSPIDPVIEILGRDARPSDIRRLEKSLYIRYPSGPQEGQLVPMWERYILTMRDLVTFSFGQSWSIERGTGVMQLVLARMPATLWLGFWSVVLALGVGVPVGLYAGLRSNTWRDYTASAGGIIWRAMPNFWLAVILAGLITAGGWLSWYRGFLIKTDVVGVPDALGELANGIDIPSLPDAPDALWALPYNLVDGFIEYLWIPFPNGEVIDIFLGLPNPLDPDIMLFGPIGIPNILEPDVMLISGAETGGVLLNNFDMWMPVPFIASFKWILPAALVLGSASMGNEVRIGRTAVLESINAKYIDTAKAKGLRSRRIISKHVGRNAVLPLLPVIMGEFYLLIGGSVIVESVFAINGLGNLFFTAVRTTDIPVVMALVFIFVLIQIFFNIAQDLLYTYIDPRISLEDAGG